MVIMTAEQVKEMNRAGLKRSIKGSDVRNHNGARSIAHKNLKKIVAKFDKRNLDY